MADIDLSGPRPAAGTVDVRWIHGSPRRRHPTDPPIGTDPDPVREFFGFTGWPGEVVRVELGDRTLELVGIPGHERSSVAVWDPWSALLFTGDTVYPGRLYVEDMPAFVIYHDPPRRALVRPAARALLAVARHRLPGHRPDPGGRLPCTFGSRPCPRGH